MDFGKQSSLIGPQTPEEINSYILHAVALQQKLVAQSHQLLPRTDSDESSESMSSTMAMNQSPIASTSSPMLKQSQSPPNNSSYPLMMGRDGKLARPFKAYPRNPLVLPATLSAADTILDRTSADKYQMFRKEMLEQIHAANGGQPTITNPRMRRTTVKATQFADAVDQKSHLQQLQQQQQQQQLQQQLQQHQQKSNNQISQIQNQQNHLNVDNNNDNDDDMDSRHSDMGSMSKDSAYYERRKKNNAAAKKSRDRRRIKEDEIAIRAAFLERENIELKYELAALKRQLTKYTST
jgi:bZIP factor